jgi:hypothetical protein
MTIWKPIVKDGIFEVSNEGQVRNTKKGHILKGSIVSGGYIQVSIGWADSIHRLVATAFIPNPDNKPIVNHINGIKNDNRVENLEWVTYSENKIHAVETGLCKTSTRKVKKYTLDGEFIEEYRSMLDASYYMKCSNNSIKRACLKEDGVFKGFIWRFSE